MQKLILILIIFISFISKDIFAEKENLSEYRIRNLEKRIDELEKRLNKIEGISVPSKEVPKVYSSPEKTITAPPKKEKDIFPTNQYNFFERISKSGYNKMGDNIFIEKAVFIVDSFRIDKVVKKDLLNRRSFTDKKYSQVYITITNKSTTDSFNYSSPSGILTDSKLEDDKGNTYKQVNFGFNSVIEGKIEGTVTVSPGARISDLIVFDAPHEDANAFLFTFSAEQFRQKGKLRILIPIKK